MVHEHLIAGILGGLSSTVVLHPLDLLKVRFAVSDGESSIKRNYKNITNAFSTIVREEGYRGLYKGVAPNCLGAGTAWGLYFFFYNKAKNYMGESKPQSSLNVWEHMGAGALAGAITTSFTNPIWVVKTRLCLQYSEVASNTASAAALSQLPDNKRYSGTWDALKKVYIHEGIRGLYRGYIPGLFGVSHGAVQLATYEAMKQRYLKKLNDPNHDIGLLQTFMFAAASKSFAAIITYPYQVVRSRLQDQHTTYQGVTDVIRKTFRYEGFLGFYKGYGVYLVHVIPNISIVFLVYEAVTKCLR